MIIAIDGPSASGKGTLARRLAAHYGYAHLDTGALYRAVALKLINIKKSLSDPTQAEQAAKHLQPKDLNDPRLREEQTGEAASRISSFPSVRAALLTYQREIANTPPGAVLDGRDVGTVVCPDADVKLFVTASAAERARRRAAEMNHQGQSADVVQIRHEIEVRDKRDTERTVSPLKQAEDAHLLDTTNLDIEAAFEAAKTLIEAAVGPK
ncbi:MAG: (d)CMP kinase [Proteobacteria bacterium]|nr:(d)CMP kinase [Pseudomonadota bacterium]